MKKYLQVLKITLGEYFAYRVNFLLWRLRSFTQVLILYFLWRAVIPEGVSVFGYSQAKILTYILGTSILRSLVFSSRSADVAGEIASGDISNSLLKPFNYLKYWFARDLADKFLNLTCGVFEVLLLLWILKPPLIIQSDPKIILLALLAVIFAVPLYFLISFLLSTIAFWVPENPWSFRFVFNIFSEFFAGALFPLDILPVFLFSLLRFLPFSYLLFFPLDVYLGKLSSPQIFSGFLISFSWIIILYWLTKLLFQKGLRLYAAWGR